MSKNVLDTVPDTKALMVNRMDKIFALIELPFLKIKRWGAGEDKDSKHVNKIDNKVMYYQFTSVQLLSRVQLFATP